MKKLILSGLVLIGLISLPACTKVEEEHPVVHSSTTTTEEHVVHRPVQSTTETQVIRSY